MEVLEENVDKNFKMGKNTGIFVIIGIKISSKNAQNFIKIMGVHLDLLKEQSLPVPPKNPNPKIVIQKEKKLAIV